MIKKSSVNARNGSTEAAAAASERKKRLEIKQIRAYVEKLIDQPDDAPMPDWSDISIGDRFAIALRLIPQTQRDRVLGKSAAHARRYEQGTDIPLTVVAALAAETLIPLDWIVTGRAMDRKAPSGHINTNVVKNFDVEPEDVPVQKFAFKVAAGRGEMMLDDTADHVRFPRGILQHVGVTPPNARLMEAAGESMKPTISDGDLLLVDISEAAAQIVDGKIYVFSLGNDAYVKRLSRSPAGSVMMISDNRDMFPPEPVPSEMAMRIYGRVKWAGRSL